MSIKRLLAVIIAVFFVGVAAVAATLMIMSSDLPKLITVQDYKPLLVSEVFDRDGEKIGEFFREKRKLVPYTDLPPLLVKAFISAEDDSFFKHGGINPQAIIRAMIANIRAGRKVQGGSTITQQVARSLLLTREKTYKRKIKEVILAYRMEQTLSKEDIMFLYLNQIYLGQGAYGVGTAAEIYFRKDVKDLELSEMAILAGLPQAPSRYSPIYRPELAKSRQRYVLRRMAEEGYISDETAQQAMETPVEVYVRKNYKELAPFYLETIRQSLIGELGEEMVLDEGIRVYTGLDLKLQLAAQEDVRKGLRELDKRQGYRGAKDNLTDAEKIAEFLLKSRNDLMDETSPVRILKPDGTIQEKGPLNLTGKDEEGNPLPNLPEYISVGQVVPGVVTEVSDNFGLVHVRFAESKGLIDIESMEWAREPNPNVRSDYDKIKNPSQALKKGDVIDVKIVSDKFSSGRLNKELREYRNKKGNKDKTPEGVPEEISQYVELELEQEPIAEASLIAFDQETEEIISLVGGYDFERSEFNRALQAARQTGSAFKALVYAAALDKGYTPATPIIDAPIVYEEEIPESELTDQEIAEAKEGDNQEGAETRKWKPLNHSKSFSGDILFRNALIKSLNVPTVKIIEDIGVEYVAEYARRLGIFSPLNMDFTMALGSSGVTLYEMTKAFAQIGNLGKRMKPILIHKVEDKTGTEILETVYLDERFNEEMKPFSDEFEKRRLAYLEQQKSGKSPESEGSAETPEDKNLASSKKPQLFFEDPDQLMKPTTAYLTTSLLTAVVEEPGGTGGKARALGRPVAGKTGTTNGYYDGWFMGYTRQIASGVWVGFDNEKTLGRGEVGGRAALPIWLDYMKTAHEGLPELDFPVPEGIVYANIDKQTGKLASADSEDVVRQAFVEGTEPQEATNEVGTEEEKNFYKEDLSE